MNAPKIDDPELVPSELLAQDSAYDNDLISAADMGDLAPQMDEKQLAQVSSSGDFLPRLQLYGGNSEAAKEGKIDIGHYGLVRGKDAIEDLGKEVDVIVVCGRPKALRITEDAIISKFDPNDEEFKKIMEDSNVPDSGCMYGPDFLLYVPSAGAFATFFMSSKTARRTAPNVFARQKKAATLKAEYIKAKKYSWHGPVCTPCSAPLVPPAEDDLKAAIKKFMQIKASDVETVKPGETTERVR